MTFKKYKIRLTLLMAALFCLGACKNNDAKPDFASNKTNLKQLTDSVSTVYTQSAEGHDLGQYPKQARANLKEAVDLATAVTSGEHTQDQVNNAVASLRRAIATFNGRKIQEIAPENLVAKWLFNGNALDATANHHDGVLMSGIIGTEAEHVDGGVLPVATTDRFGQAGNAYEFANGAYIEVPYSVALNPELISISLWVRPKESFGNNYMLSLNKWNGFKFQLQSDNFLFMTLKTGSATYDRDSNPGKMVNGEWHHAVVTAGNGSMVFYVDGVQVKSEGAAGTAFRLAAPVNLAIGQQLPKNKYTYVPAGDPFHYSGPNFFKGAMDDIRYYNKVLSPAEVMSVYNNEKPD